MAAFVGRGRCSIARISFITRLRCAGRDAIIIL